MKIHVSKAFCDVCGCEGVATPDVAAQNWFVGSHIRHSDPEICRDNLERKREELEAREKALNIK